MHDGRQRIGEVPLFERLAQRDFMNVTPLGGITCLAMTLRTALQRDEQAMNDFAMFNTDSLFYFCIGGDITVTSAVKTYGSRNKFVCLSEAGDDEELNPAFACKASGTKLARTRVISLDVRNNKRGVLEKCVEPVEILVDGGIGLAVRRPVPMRHRHQWLGPGQCALTETSRIPQYSLGAGGSGGGRYWRWGRRGSLALWQPWRSLAMGSPRPMVSSL